MFHRSYDLSCILDIPERTYIQNAINGVNIACTDMVDAWIYVEQGHLLEDTLRTLGPHDYIPKAVFAIMASDNHTDHSFSSTLSTLQIIAQDYESWRIIREQENSRREDSTNFWSSWRNIKLTPYYHSTSGGARVSSIGPILEDFLSLKASRDELSEDCSKIECELMNHLGQDYQKQIDILTDIVSIEHSPHCYELLIRLKKRLSDRMSMEKHDDVLAKEALSQLSSAIESLNPTALRASLNPGWYSVKFQNTDLYKRGVRLLTELS